MYICCPSQIFFHWDMSWVSSKTEQNWWSYGQFFENISNKKFQSAPSVLPIAEQLESIHLSFYTKDAFNAVRGFGHGQKVNPRRAMQKAAVLVLQCQKLAKMKTEATRSPVLDDSSLTAQSDYWYHAARRMRKSFSRLARWSTSVPDSTFHGVLFLRVVAVPGWDGMHGFTDVRKACETCSIGCAFAELEAYYPYLPDYAVALAVAPHAHRHIDILSTTPETDSSEVGRSYGGARAMGAVLTSGGEHTGTAFVQITAMLTPSSTSLNADSPSRYIFDHDYTATLGVRVEETSLALGYLFKTGWRQIGVDSGREHTGTGTALECGSLLYAVFLRYVGKQRDWVGGSMISKRRRWVTGLRWVFRICGWSG
ncbi:hypothetical protein GGX14DRAFT_396979 [Mycena pura]|uniref:Uncharacterized protein n=1 Tax=Mycena pura TaxID=153505 RepID=A0AAD6YD46_9AGAR|nr:hypothetical protein GGX14DRAFT_396979 [Mycena pura]